MPTVRRVLADVLSSFFCVRLLLGLACIHGVQMWGQVNLPRVAE